MVTIGANPGSIQCGGLFRIVSSRKLLLLCLFTMMMAAYVVHQMSITYTDYIRISKGKYFEAERKQGVNPRVDNMCDDTELKHFPNGSVDFRGFNNYTGYPSGCYVVPDIVHLIKFNQEEFNFIEMICIASILINHKPQSVRIHTNNLFGFKGKYWDVIQRLPNFDRVQLVYLMKPTSIYGFSLEHGYGAWHSSDIARLRLIQTYGGIYFDSDVFVVQSMHPYRRFEFGLEWNYHMNLGTQIEFGHKDARVIPLWLETYKQYNSSLWYYNAGELPTTAILEPMPELIHRVRDKFGTDTNMLGLLYNTGDFKWQEYSCLHLFIRHQGYEFNETSVFQYKQSPIREMILSVLPEYMFGVPTKEEEPKVNEKEDKPAKEDKQDHPEYMFYPTKGNKS
ncbi:hypothetical protein WDU94_005350 [Cyamophila willieti]